MVVHRHMIVLEEYVADFFVLDDSKYLTLGKNEQSFISRFMNYLKKKQVCVKKIEMDELASLILAKLKEDNAINDIDMIVTIGTGGRELFAAMKEYFGDKETVDVLCKRVWKNNSLLEFEDDISDYHFQGKKIMLIDDVVATGFTLNHIIEKIEASKGIVTMVAVGIGSCHYTDNGRHPFILGNRLYEKHEHVLSNKEEAYWYPAIYSIRHLLNEENGMVDLKEKMAKMYFDNDTEIIKVMNRM